MMAAMMFPSVAPTVALYSKLQERSEARSTARLHRRLPRSSGPRRALLAFALAWVGGELFGDVLAWDRAGRWVAGVTLLVAAVYELTPLKDVCLGKCRTPLGFLLGSWRDGLFGRAEDGAHDTAPGASAAAGR